MPVAAPTDTLVAASWVVSDAFVDSKSKYTNVKVGFEGESPAPAPPVSSVAVMLSKQFESVCETGLTTSEERK